MCPKNNWLCVDSFHIVYSQHFTWFDWADVLMSALQLSFSQLQSKRISKTIRTVARDLIIAQCYPLLFTIYKVRVRTNANQFFLSNSHIVTSFHISYSYSYSYHYPYVIMVRAIWIIISSKVIDFTLCCSCLLYVILKYRITKKTKL
jgi:hypothetical protein